MLSLITTISTDSLVLLVLEKPFIDLQSVTSSDEFYRFSPLLMALRRASALDSYLPVTTINLLHGLIFVTPVDSYVL